jgi:hypothetical protein
MTKSFCFLERKYFGNLRDEFCVTRLDAGSPAEWSLNCLVRQSVIERVA